MWHLNPEDLARLVDEAPQGAEAEHLAACDACAGEVEAMREQVDELRALPHILPDPTPWRAMRQRLLAEGLLAGQRVAPRGWMQAAAALTLFLMGGALGFVARDGVAAPSPATAAVAVADGADRTSGELPVLEPSPSGSALGSAAGAVDTREGELDVQTERRQPADVQGADEHTPAPLPAEGYPRATVPADGYPPTTRFAARGQTSNQRVTQLVPGEIDSAEEAALLMRRTEDAYLAAMTRFAELTGPAEGDLALRIATLDGIVVTTAAALREAPADPVINGYHLAARAQRDAMLKTVSTTTTEDPWF